MEHNWILVVGLILLVVGLSVIAAAFLSPRSIAPYPDFMEEPPMYKRPEPPPIPPCKQPETSVEERLREINNSVLELQFRLQELKVQVDKVLEKHK